ncbi:MAG: PilZ domain-containing protein [Deltaproteobacteria bacterium]|nr:PilZ domain-containing protein [Deltaproteobacteria bacterium]
MSLGWILIGGFIALILLLLAKDEYYDRQEQKKGMEMRAEIAWPVVIKTDRDSREGRTVNVSASGALLCFTQQLSLMEIVTLTIRPPVRAALEITAEVVRTNIPCDNDDSTRRGAAVRFIIISEKARESVSFSVFDHLQQKPILISAEKEI